MFWKKIFYGCKIISSGMIKTKHLHQNFFDRKFVMVAKSFSSGNEPRIFKKHFLVENIL